MSPLLGCHECGGCLGRNNGKAFITAIGGATNSHHILCDKCHAEAMAGGPGPNVRAQAAGHAGFAAAQRKARRGY